MKTIQKQYDKYKIMPTLQLHQLRVASVAKMVCENFKEKLDMHNVILACLFHDMGNIIKSDLKRFPDFLEPKGLEYWQAVKDEFLQKYGNEEHVAMEIIAKEIGLPEHAMAFLKRIGFSNIKKTDSEGSFENKICSYSDMRVGPYGVISIEERMAEGKKRYEGRIHSIVTDLELHGGALRNIEKDIFAHANIKPEQITDAAIQETIESLRNYSFV